MLSICAIGGAGSYYLGLGGSDFYELGEEPPGLYYGEGAEALCLKGAVQGDEFYNLLAGRSPDGSRQLVQIQRRDDRVSHRAGFDLTFSVPKSLSVLWSQANPETRSKIEGAVLESVRAVIDYLQSTAAFGRRGKGGVELERVGLVSCLFLHGTSRSKEPNLHVHAIVANVGVSQDGKVSAIDGHKLYEFKMCAGALFRTDLSALLSERLGLASTRIQSSFELVGVSKGLCREFSSRSVEIRANMAASAGSGPKAAAIAALVTRQPKEFVPRSQLFQDWRSRGREYGWSTQEAERLIHGPSDLAPSALADRILDRSLKSLMQTESPFTSKDVVRLSAIESQARGIRASTLVQSVHEKLNSNEDLVRVGISRGQEHFVGRNLTNSISQTETLTVSTKVSPNKKNLINVSNSRLEAMKDLVAEWARGRAASRNGQAIIASTPNEVHALNLLAQHARLAKREIGGASLEHEGQRFFAGDRVAFTRNAKARGIEKGAQGIIEFIDVRDESLRVRLSNGDRRSFALSEFGHITLGYACTQREAQNGNSERVYLLAGKRISDKYIASVERVHTPQETFVFVDRQIAVDSVRSLPRTSASTKHEPSAISNDGSFHVDAAEQRHTRIHRY